MNQEEENKLIETVVREQLAEVEETYDMDEINPWLNGYRSALLTVLQEANGVKGERKMKPEEEENVQVVTRRLVKAWLELRHVIRTLPEGEDTKRLIKGNAQIEDGLGVILLLRDI